MQVFPPQALCRLPTSSPMQVSHFKPYVGFLPQALCNFAGSTALEEDNTSSSLPLTICLCILHLKYEAANN